MAKVIEITTFLEYLGKIPLLDVRSEGEYNKGHVPDAVNIALLSNEHRAIVGTVYKQQGRAPAVLKGFELIGPLFQTLLQQWLNLVNEKKVMVYCWRGGMRSNIAAWMLGLCGVKVLLLKGGYKAYRHWAQQQLAIKKNILVLGGPTGAGKTELLNALKAKNEQIIDLEQLANHRGSAFGALGMQEQPTYEHFENMLALQWAIMDNEKPLWVENESRLIGTVKLPDVIFELMRHARVIEIDIPLENRFRNILQEYGQYSIPELTDCTKKLKKRLGDLRTKQAVQYLEQGERQEWLAMMLEYYDKFYDYNNTLRASGTISRISFKDENIETKAERLIELSKQAV